MSLSLFYLHELSEIRVHIKKLCPMIISKILLLTYDLISMIKLGLANLCLGLVKWLHPILGGCIFIVGLHYSDVIMGAIASQINSLTIVYSTVYSGADKKNREFPAQMASSAENDSIWWRHCC